MSQQQTLQRIIGSYSLYWRTCGKVLAYSVMVWDDATVHAGWSGLTRYHELLELANGRNSD